MEKLQPLLVHKFWILFAIALLLPLTGWWMANSNMASTIDDRTGTLESAFSGVPGGSNTPNDDWAKKLEKLNELQKERNQQAANFLLKAQKQAMIWPDTVSRSMQDISYRGEIPVGVRNTYKSRYPLEIQRLREIVDPLENARGNRNIPFRNQEGRNNSAEDQGVSGKVQFAARLPAKHREWGRLTPSSKEIWDAQEDIWLLRSLLLAVKRTNEGATSIADAPVRRIDRIQLMGGSREDAGSGGGGGMNSMEGMEGYGDSGGDYAGGGGGTAYGDGFGSGSYGSGMGGAGGSQSIPSADFDPKEEFGDPSVASSGGSEGGTPSSSSSPSYGGDAAGSGTGSYGMGGQTKELRRYVDDREELPYRTRGFYMKVVMESQRLPDLLVELTNSRWPVQIVRVQQAEAGATTGGGNYSTGGSYSTGDFAGSTPQGYGGESYNDSGSTGYGSTAGAYPSSTGQYGSTPTGGGLGGEGNFGRNRRIGPADIIEGALSDPYLVEVAIAGLMTIYKHPEAEENGEETEGPITETVTPAANQPAENQSGDSPAQQDGAPQNTADGAQPADSQESPSTPNNPMPVQPNAPNSEAEKKTSPRNPGKSPSAPPEGGTENSDEGGATGEAESPSDPAQNPRPSADSKQPAEESNATQP